MDSKYPSITSVMLNLTHACNLRCRYCFVHQEQATMTLQTAKDAANFLIANCAEGEIPSINFFGGEPMLCWDSIIVPLTKYIREELSAPFDISMTTNGTLLNQDRIDFMKQYQIGILFSIDGGAETQNYNRPFADGSGSFNALRDIIPVLASEFNPTFRMTAIPESCSHLFDDIMFAVENGFKRFFVIPNVFQAWTDSEWEVLCREVRKYADYFIRCYVDGVDPIRFSEFEQAIRKIVLVNYAIDHGECRDRCDACNKCGLGAGRFASIHPNGDVYACQEMTSNEGKDSPFWIGNIYTGIVEERRTALLHRFDKHQIAGLNCNECRLFRICDGGCVANNYLITGNVNHMPDTYCRWQQLLFDESIYVMNSLADNPRFISDWRNNYGR